MRDLLWTTIVVFMGLVIAATVIWVLALLYV